MLVLRRKPEEKILIDDNILVNVIERSDEQLKLGIEAPKEVSIV